jgi:RNA-directed DNA polymerase
MKTYKHLYEKICSYENLFLAYKKARKGKTKKRYVIDFEANLRENLLELQEELINDRYYPKPLKTFIYCNTLCSWHRDVASVESRVLP